MSHFSPYPINISYGSYSCVETVLLDFASCIYFQSVGTSCVNMYSLLLPIIQLSTDVKHDSHVYLYEDGLDLWLATVYCSPSITPQLLDLFTNMEAILGLCRLFQFSLDCL
jgi:hypothetical protein